MELQAAPSMSSEQLVTPSGRHGLFSSKPAGHSPMVPSAAQSGKVAWPVGEQQLSVRRTHASGEHESRSTKPVGQRYLWSTQSGARPSMELQFRKQVGCGPSQVGGVAAPPPPPAWGEPVPTLLVDPAPAVPTESGFEPTVFPPQATLHRRRQ